MRVTSLAAVILAIVFIPLAVPTVQTQISSHAQGHAERLSSGDSIFHSDLNPLSTNQGGPCEWVGENIYAGSDPTGEARWLLYAGSPTHNVVLNHPRTHHAVGKATLTDGRYVFVDVFCQAARAPAPTPTTATTTAIADDPTPTQIREVVFCRLVLAHWNGFVICIE